MSDLLDEDALAAHMELSEKLHQWASTAHKRVVERVDALLAVYPDDHPSGESARSWIERCHAHQHPFPEGASIYSDLNCNTGYDHVEVTYGFSHNPGGRRVQYTGRYPVWDRQRDDFDMHTAEIHVPTWLLTDPDGVERYRRETAEMVAKLTAQRAAEEAEMEALMARILGERQ